MRSKSELEKQLEELAERKRKLQRRRQALRNSEEPTLFLDKLISHTDKQKNGVLEELDNEQHQEKAARAGSADGS